MQRVSSPRQTTPLSASARIPSAYSFSTTPAKITVVAGAAWTCVAIGRKLLLSGRGFDYSDTALGTPSRPLGGVELTSRLAIRAANTVPEVDIMLQAVAEGIECQNLNDGKIGRASCRER